MSFWWTTTTKAERQARLEANLQDSNLPISLHGGIVRYMIHGIIPGSFLEAIICNDEDSASMRASMDNVPAIPAIMEWFQTDTPRDSWGSKDKMRAYAALQKGRE